MAAVRDASQRIRQCVGRLPNGALIKETLALIASAYLDNDEPWVIGYSGGKDSTALLKLVFQALLRVDYHHKLVTVVYCDTGVEIPLASSLAKTALAAFNEEARQHDLPIKAFIVSPPVNDRFFVKVLGRGYPPPTDKFRWCTDRLRINPVTAYLKKSGLESATVLLGVREAESTTRRQTLHENQTTNRYWRHQRGIASRRLFLPILDYSLRDVWMVNLLVERPMSLRAEQVANLYASASGECPTVRDVKGAPCGKARFGCWTCTVAKNGVTMRNLIASGEHRLKPLLDFRLWLDSKRNNPRYRWRRRRNGTAGLGPMTLEWRRMGLAKLLQAQESSGLPLISTEEISAIQAHWRAE